MAVQQNECYRLVTIGYLKKLIEQSGSGSSLKSLIQKSDGTYQGVEGTRDDYCPTYGELSAGTYVQVYKAGTTPNGDIDGLVINQRWKGDTGQTYTVNQCVDRADVSVRYTRMSALQLSVGKHTFDGCGESGTSVTVSHAYNRKTKSMSGCAADEGSIVYSTAATETSVACNTTLFTFHKSLANTVSTISCTKYDITKNTGTTERTDDVYVTVKFRGTNYDSNHELLTQPAGDGAYSKVVSTTNIPTDITVTPSHTNYKVPATCNDKCVASANTTVSLTPKGVYDVVTTYSYVQCGVDIPSKGTITAVTKTGQTINLPVVSSAFTASGICSDEVAPVGSEINIASKNVTVNWSGLTLTRTFLMTAITKHCESPTPISECCQLHGPMSLTCSGTVQFSIGECGCDNMVDLGLPSGLKWGQYPLGTDEHYNTFKWYQWGNTEQYTGSTEQFPDSWTGDVVTSHKEDCANQNEAKYTTQLSSYPDHECIKKNYPDSGYRMPTRAEAEELLSETTQQYVEDYNGTGRNGWKIIGSNGNHIFLPAAGEWYPDEDTHTSYQRNDNYITYCWLATGDYYYYWKDSTGEHCSTDATHPDRATTNGFRLTDLNAPHTGLSVRESSRYYGNIIIPVCDKG